MKLQGESVLKTPKTPACSWSDFDSLNSFLLAEREGVRDEGKRQLMIVEKYLHKVLLPVWDSFLDKGTAQFYF